MVGTKVVFRKVIRKVLSTASPLQIELPVVLDSILQLVKTHINSLGLFLFHCAIKDAACCFIVGTDELWRLGMTHVDQCLAPFDDQLCIQIN